MARTVISVALIWKYSDRLSSPRLKSTYILEPVGVIALIYRSHPPEMVAMQ
jgi:hypothetical protein